jgi:endo-1,4-beta-xylanase
MSVPGGFVAALLKRGSVPALAAAFAACGSGPPTAPAPTPRPTPAVAAVDPLRDAAAAAGRRIGTAVQADLLRDPVYAGTFARHFDSVTAEWEMKWGQIERQPGVRDYTRADAIVSFAEARGIRVRGHTLLWHGDSPAWVESLSGPELLIAVEDHIRETVGRYRGRVAAWDVVNEAVADDGSGLRDTVFQRRLGPDYLAFAFRRARETDPDVELVYNDYGGEGLGRKSDRIYALLRELKAQGAPVDAVGLQMHLDAAGHPPLEEISQNMRRLAELGLRIDITEMDVRIRRLPGDLAARLETQRRLYHDVVAACVAEPACQSVTFWGFTDKHSWIHSFFGPDDPLLFDESYRPKPAFFGVRDALLGR